MIKVKVAQAEVEWLGSEQQQGVNRDTAIC